MAHDTEDRRCRDLLRQYEELTARLADPAAAADPARYAEISRQHAALSPIADTCRALEAAKQQQSEAEALLADGSERELHELARQELTDAKAQIDRLTQQLRVQLLPKDPNDQKNVIVEIRAGAGGEESALFAAVLRRMYTMYAAAHGFGIEPLSENATPLGGCKEVSFLVTGTGAYSRLKFESGVHRVQRVPETEAGGRIHTSTATVAVLPEAEEVELSIDPADLLIDTYRASGAGGQHINKTESAIRITHLPTGMVVECQDERSQYKNKDKAMRVLRSRLLEQKQQAQQSAIAADRRAQVGTGDRSERIRTYNYPQGRVTDHRIGLTLYKLDAVLDGALDELIDALTAAERTALLEKESEN